jgi:Xaa-Pro dipeptidase
MLNEPRARQILDQYGVDWLVLSTPENVFYASDFRSLAHWEMRSSEVEVLVALPREDPGAGFLIMSAQEADQAAARLPSIKHIETYGGLQLAQGDRKLWDEAAERLAALVFKQSAEDDPYAVLRRLGIIDSTARVAVDSELVGTRLSGALDLKSPPLVGKHIVEAIRIVKTGEEIARLREATRISEVGIQACIEALREGVTELEIARIFDTRVVEEGALPFMTIVGFGSNGAFGNHPPTSTRLRRDSLVRLDVGCEVGGYRPDLAYVSCFGTPSARLLEYWEVIEEVQAAALSKIAPSARFDEPYYAGVEVLDGRIPGYIRKHVGHGVGVELRESPMLAPSDRPAVRGTYFELDRQAGFDRFEPGMVVAVEAPHYELGLGAVQIEQTVVITEDGYEFLTQLPHERAVGEGPPRATTAQAGRAEP